MIPPTLNPPPPCLCAWQRALWQEAVEDGLLSWISVIWVRTLKEMTGKHNPREITAWWIWPFSLGNKEPEIPCILTNLKYIEGQVEMWTRPRGLKLNERIDHTNLLTGSNFPAERGRGLDTGKQTLVLPKWGLMLKHPEGHWATE